MFVEVSELGFGAADPAPRRAPVEGEAHGVGEGALEGRYLTPRHTDVQLPGGVVDLGGEPSRSKVKAHTLDEIGRRARSHRIDGVHVVEARERTSRGHDQREQQSEDVNDPRK